MIVVRLVGGLGNQMFQYAAGLSTAEKLETDLFIDNSWFKKPLLNETPRNYELKKFNIENKIISSKEYILKTEGFLRNLFKIGNPSLNYYREKSFRYDKDFENIKNNTYIEGYFQSEKYFNDIRGDVIKAFTLKNKASLESVKIIDQIKNSNSVSLHVRRGDYVSNKNANKFHGLLNEIYYKKAIKIIKQKVDRPQFFIFSDEIEWVGKNFDLPKEATFVTHNKSGIEDMRIMMECKHNIIANSSFSWWGAWLGDQNGKLVVSPNDWFQQKNINTSDLIPERWIRV